MWNIFGQGVIICETQALKHEHEYPPEVQLVNEKRRIIREVRLG